MKETHFAPWMCGQCGYMMDTTSHLRKNISPKKGDISICFNCGALYSLDGEVWKPLSLQERATLPDKVKREIFTYEMARRSVVDHDLSKRDRRT